MTKEQKQQAIKIISRVAFGKNHPDAITAEKAVEMLQRQGIFK